MIITMDWKTFLFIRFVKEFGLPILAVVVALWLLLRIRQRQVDKRISREVSE